LPSYLPMFATETPALCSQPHSVRSLILSGNQDLFKQLTFLLSLRKWA